MNFGDSFSDFLYICIHRNASTSKTEQISDLKSTVSMNELCLRNNSNLN
jgi:hypothetical protein